MTVEVRDLLTLLTFATVAGGVTYTVWDVKRQVQEIDRMLRNGLSSRLVRIEQSINDLPCRNAPVCPGDGNA